MIMLQMFIEKNILALLWIVLSAYGFSLTRINLIHSLRSWRYSVNLGEDEATIITVFSHVKVHLFMLFMHTSFILVGFITILFTPDERRAVVTLAIFFAIPVTLIFISRTIRKDMDRASSYNSPPKVRLNEANTTSTASSNFHGTRNVVWKLLSKLTDGKWTRL